MRRIRGREKADARIDANPLAACDGDALDGRWFPRWVNSIMLIGVYPPVQQHIAGNFHYLYYYNDTRPKNRTIIGAVLSPFRSMVFRVLNSATFRGVGT